MSNRLWPHQELAIKLVGDEARAGKRAIVIVIPTGGGKTKLAAALAVRHLAKKPDGKVLFCAHREELVSQSYDAFTEDGLSCGVIQATPSRPMNPYRSTQIASTQTLLARNLIIDGVTLLIADECHHYASDKWSKLLLEYRKRKAFIIGLTATPMRADGRGLGDIEDSV